MSNRSLSCSKHIRDPDWWKRMYRPFQYYQVLQIAFAESRAYYFAKHGFVVVGIQNPFGFDRRYVRLDYGYNGCSATMISRDEVQCLSFRHSRRLQRKLCFGTVLETARKYCTENSYNLFVYNCHNWTGDITTKCDVEDCKHAAAFQKLKWLVIIFLIGLCVFTVAIYDFPPFGVLIKIDGLFTSPGVMRN